MHKRSLVFAHSRQREARNTVLMVLLAFTGWSACIPSWRTVCISARWGRTHTHLLVHNPEGVWLGCQPAWMQRRAGAEGHNPALAQILVVLLDCSACTVQPAVAFKDMFSLPSHETSHPPHDALSVVVPKRAVSWCTACNCICWGRTHMSTSLCINLCQ